MRQPIRICSVVALQKRVDYGLFIFDNFNNQNGPLFTIIWPNYATFIFLFNSDQIKILSLIFTTNGQPLAQPTGNPDASCHYHSGVTMENLRDSCHFG